ncbi:YgiW/YdeI family stress tolerance OB fold protein [Candidatus Bandiella numerosa]|uniref:YgiW/YdeI family stress tolerance OB fold protein n=1 Tax=Candidatus Bandiella numerosa TaxID=2570586 RepID=UPI001F2BC487|nr:NirD/YgiW/YdeI family stress tolerance protein [Candidatus Bandiella numerosa]
MKKVVSKALMLSCMSLGLVCFANAEFKGPQAQSLTHPSQGLTTVQTVLNGAFHGQQVFLQGNIAQKISHDKYMFKDSTGEIVIDIDQKHMPFEDFSASDTVKIYGEVEMKRKNPRIEIDVARVEVVKQATDVHKK